MQVDHPWTCTCVRLLGPCFKTGQKTHTCLRGHASWHIDSQINQCRMLVCTNMHAWFRNIDLQSCIIPPDQICWHTMLVSAIIVRNPMHTQYHWMRAMQQPMATTNATHCNLTLHCNFIFACILTVSSTVELAFQRHFSHVPLVCCWCTHPSGHLHCACRWATNELARALDSLVRVSRRAQRHTIA